MKTLLSLLLACFITTASINLFAQDVASMTKNEKIAEKAFKNKGEVIIKFIVNNKDIINNDLTNIISIDYVKQLQDGRYEVTAYANNKKEMVEFLSRNISYTIIEKSTTKAINMATSVADMMTGWTKYPTYAIYEQAMAQFASNYPTLCQIDTILNLASGRRILVAQITSNVGTPANKPQFLYSSSMHGDEITGLMMMLRLTNLLLTSYGSNTRLTNMVNNVDLWICPMANPDGTYYNSSGGTTVANSRRGNANNVDLNRNYPDPRAGQHPDGNSWQPETQAFMTFAGNHHFNMAANFHGGAELFNFPWDTWASSSRTAADDNWWRYVGNQFADSAQAFGPSGYFTGPGGTNTTGVTEGGDWYVVTGGRQDYMNYWHYCREVCIEISDTKIGPSEDLNTFWTTLYRPLLRLVEQSTYGVRGIIKDSCSNNPIKAKVFITAWDKDSSHVYSALPIGNYHRYLKAGTYNLTFSASGYQSKTVTGVVVVDGQATTLNVNLRQIAPVAAFSADVTSTCTGTVNFTNQSSSSATSWVWTFGDGGTSSLQNPSHTYTSNGTYTVKLKVNSCAGKDSLIKTSYITVALPASPTVTPGSRCGTGTVGLVASGSGTLNWYDAPSAGSMVYTGTNYTTPSLSATTTYYVESNLTPAPVTTGMTFTGTGGGGTSTGEHYLVFDALSAFTLVSVKVNNTSTSAVTKTIQLKNSSNTVLQEVTNVSIPSGTSTVALNFSVPVGTDLRLSCTSGVSLYRNNTGVAYPYTSAGNVSIKTSDAGTGFYYYFYEWLIQTGSNCVSARVPVTATINNYPDAGFTNSIVNNTVNFTSTSSYAISYLWTFGDGGTSTLTNPSHTYTSNGTFNVKLKVTNACGSDSITYPVTITTVGISDIENGKLGVNIFPNPSTGNFNLSIYSAQGDNCTLLIYNILGECLYREYFGLSAGNTTHSLNLEALGKGLYYMKLDFNSNSYIQKVVIR